MIELCQTTRLDLADAYLVALAEQEPDGAIVSFDKGLDRIPTVKRIEPPAVA